MAAKETVNTPKNEVEFIINRWLVDYYYCCLLEVFKKDHYDDFCDIRGVVESVLARPVQSTDVMPTKFKVLQFLSRINEGEKLDLTFELDQSITPLESALAILELMSSENLISPQDFQKVSTSLKEMLVGILIKNKEFDKAKEVLNKHFPEKMVGKKAIFTGLVRQKSTRHEVIEKINYQQFKQEMVAFCERLCPVGVPFLHQAAKRLLGERKEKEDGKAAEAVEQEEPGPSSQLPLNITHFIPCKHSVIIRTRLEAAYIALSHDSDERPFVQLEVELEREEQGKKRDSHSLHCSLAPENSTNQDSEQELIFQRDSGSPMEASPAEQTPQTDAVLQEQAGSLSKTPAVKRTRRPPYNLARLVVEPDSQGSSQSTPALQDQLADLRTEERPQSAAKAKEKNWNRAATSLAELSAEIENDSSDELHEETNRSLTNSNKSKRISSDSTEDPQESSSPCKTPRKRLARDPLNKQVQIKHSFDVNMFMNLTFLNFMLFLCRDQANASDMMTDSSLDSSPMRFPLRPVPRTSSTPQMKDEGSSHSKWKKLYNNAKESRDTWSDEETYFSSRKNSKTQDESNDSNTGQKRKMWTEAETVKLRKGVKKFGEGNWSKIKDYYSFNYRTNVQLKDRWRTMKKLKLV
ncbi:LOW QUALITY PROTEIN: telomeric repeat binding factor a [Labrus mixtus]|uniref:LOW QUALITY PROTEIN: telomeric repeat binding factor a n=1 Tax=Labrus mixtus TaxID=508554 RepID=UPI0029C08B8C|nr:LOW QUALITY PROTEIN: telomeric repeat binding factor a [Labrus mixtus]